MEARAPRARRARTAPSWPRRRLPTHTLGCAARAVTPLRHWGPCNRCAAGPRHARKIVGCFGKRSMLATLALKRGLAWALPSTATAGCRHLQGLAQADDSDVLSSGLSGGLTFAANQESMDALISRLNSGALLEEPGAAGSAAALNRRSRLPPPCCRSLDDAPLLPPPASRPSSDIAQVLQGGGAKAVQRHHARGKLLPRCEAPSRRRCCFRQAPPTALAASAPHTVRLPSPCCAPLCTGSASSCCWTPAPPSWSCRSWRGGACTVRGGRQAPALGGGRLSPACFAGSDSRPALFVLCLPPLLENEEVPCGGIVTGIGSVHGRLVAIAANDATGEGRGGCCRVCRLVLGTDAHLAPHSSSRLSTLPLVPGFPIELQSRLAPIIQSL